MAATVPGIHLGIDTHANRPAGNTVPDASFYSCSTHGLIYKSNFAGNSWATWATLGAPAGAGALVGCRLRNSANQSLANAVFTVLTFDTETYDTDGFHSTSSNTDRITIPTGKGGYYFVWGIVQYATNGTGTRVAAITLNGTDVVWGAKVTGNASGSTITMVSDTILCVATDILRLAAFQDRGSALNAEANAAPDFPVFGATLIGV